MGVRASADTAFAVFIDRLIDLISSLAPEADGKDTRIFRDKLEEYRRVVMDPSRQMEVPRITEACIATCQQYFQLSKKYHDHREAEFTEIMRILRDAAKVNVGDSTDFNAQVLASTERFGNLVNVDDIRVLKQHLSAEVTALRLAVEEKQKRDELAYSQLTKRVEALEAQLNEAEEEAALDGLTRVSNRGRFNRMLARLIEQARANETPLSMAILDVDNFKQINDTHGHPIGDRVLVCAAQWLTKSVRQTDFVARYGGEEFAVLLPNTSVGQVQKRLETLLEDIAGSCYEYELLGKREKVTFTLSCGLADLQPEETDEEFISRTDEALYEAKRKGKNRVVVCKKSVGIKSLFGLR